MQVRKHPEDKAFDWRETGYSMKKQKTADTRFHEHTTYASRYVSFNVVTMTLYKRLPCNIDYASFTSPYTNTILCHWHRLCDGAG